MNFKNSNPETFSILINMNNFRLNEITTHRKSNFDTEALIMPFIQELRLTCYRKFIQELEADFQFNLLLRPYPCFISLLYLDLYVLGDDALIS